MIDRFLQYLQFEKRYSEHTLTAYSKDLTDFHGFLSENFENVPLEKVDNKMIRSWVAQLMDDGISARSIRRKLSALKTFYRYLQRNDIVDANPASGVVAPKMQQRLTSFIPQSYTKELFTDEPLPENFSDVRDIVIMETLYATGMRRSELVQLKDSDVNLSNRTIRVLGKGNKTRIIPMTAKLGAVIEVYFRKKTEKFGLNKTNLFLVTNDGNPVYPQFIYRKVKQYLISVNLEKRSPHVLRHTFATHLMDEGADINAVKELLGHSGLAATQIYTHNTIDKLKNTYKHAHPRAK